MKQVHLICASCNKPITKPKKEYDRQIRKNPDRQFYCDNVCSGKSQSNLKHLQQHARTFSPEEQRKGTEAARKVNQKYSDKDKIFIQMLRSVQNRKSKNLNEITMEFLKELWDKQGGACALTHIPLDSEGPKVLRPSLDRKDSSIGYAKDNVQIVCLAANMGKGSCSDEDFKEFVRAIIRNNC